MLAYKPKEEPVLTKIVKGGLFQFLMVVFLGVGVTYFVVRTDQPQKWIQKINRFASVSPNISPQALTEAGVESAAQDFESPPAAVNNWAARGMGAGTSGTAAAMAAGVSSSSSENLEPSTQSSSTVSAPQNALTNIRMLEVDNEYLNAIVQQAHTTNNVLQDDEIKIFIVPKATTISAAQVLNSGNMTIVRSQTNVMNFGTSNRGFTLETTFSALADNAYSLGLRFNKSHPNNPLQLPVDFVLRPGEKLVVAGYPLLSYFEFENELANMTPFQIFKSLDYRNQKTTFAIVVELQ